jgi:hypothetical protein
MSRRSIPILIAALLASVLLAGCNRTVRVETGERIVCTYGEVVTDTVHTIEVSAADAATYHVVSKTVTCDRHKRLESLYADAQAAILAADLAAARLKLAEVVKTEPQFRNAQRQIDAIDAGATPAVDKGAPKTPGSPGSVTPAPAGDKQPVGPVATLASWVPASLPGYTSTPILADVYTLTREYLPGGSAPTDNLVVVVEQYKDAAAAAAAIRNDLARSYPASSSTLTISGRSVYFGTDSKRHAIVAWNENGVVVAIEGTPRNGGPASLRSHLSSLVTAIVK